jgi:hypothetical protein
MRRRGGEASQRGTREAHRASFGCRTVVKPAQLTGARLQGCEHQHGRAGLTISITMGDCQPMTMSEMATAKSSDSNEAIASRHFSLGWVPHIAHYTIKRKSELWTDEDEETSVGTALARRDATIDDRDRRRTTNRSTKHANMSRSLGDATMCEKS